MSNNTGLAELLKRFHALVSPIGRIDSAIRKLTNFIFNKINDNDRNSNNNYLQPTVNNKLENKKINHFKYEYSSITKKSDMPICVNTTDNKSLPVKAVQILELMSPISVGKCTIDRLYIHNNYLVQATEHDNNN